MGDYTSIRGWIEVHDKSLPKLYEILSNHEVKAEAFGLSCDHAKFYNQGWIIPEEHINWTHYIFYGADIRTQAVDFIRSQMKSISGTYMLDEEIDDNWGFYPSGIIHVNEDGTFGAPNEVWTLGDGQMQCKQLLENNAQQAIPDTPPAK